MNLDRVIAVRTNKTVYRDGDKCIKVFDSDYSKADVLNEALNQARIEETGLNIPKVLEVCTIEGKWAIVSEYIKGKTLSQLMQEHPEKKDEYLRLFVETQLLVQSKTCPLLSRPIWTRPRAMICTPAWRACPSITRYATAISAPPT